MTKYELLAELQMHATRAVVTVSANDAFGRATAQYHIERISALLAELDAVFQGEQKEPLIAQLNASVKLKEKP